MINGYEWVDHYLLLTVKSRHGTYPFLLNRMSQEEFLEHWNAKWEESRDRRILDIAIVHLTEQAFELMEDDYEPQYVLEG